MLSLLYAIPALYVLLIRLCWRWHWRTKGGQWCWQENCYLLFFFQHDTCYRLDWLGEEGILRYWLLHVIHKHISKMQIDCLRLSIGWYFTLIQQFVIRFFSYSRNRGIWRIQQIRRTEDLNWWPEKFKLKVQLDCIR